MDRMGLRSFDYRPDVDKPFEPIDLHDPYGLRNAVLPLFKYTHQGIRGLGTGFLIDDCADIATAEHIVGVSDFDLRDGDVTPGGSGDVHIDLGRFFQDHQIITMINPGDWGGTIHMPRGLVRRIVGMEALFEWTEDPMAALQGNIRVHSIADLAFLKTEPHIEDFARKSGLTVSAVSPQIGDWVCAIGYPNIDVRNYRSEAAMDVLISEETMQLAFGKVLALHEDGRGRTDRMPVFEVECLWASGMSGGPVLNENGEVVGVVSRSIEPQLGEGSTVGTATLLLRGLGKVDELR